MANLATRSAGGTAELEAKARAVEIVLKQQLELDQVAHDLAEAQEGNRILSERNEMLTNYIDNLMYTVTRNDLALAPPATRSKGMNPMRRFAMLAPVLERAPSDNHMASRDR
ncbi:hypothetical protein KFE25_008240 [Diacronema lutheri]|uniref:Uncharacterized protein n=1 Tax=Diacronema lutheri TaxID=2081491 RepID=A0A8J5XNY7_DIALT|nr:hypothetical protein KFE25_008240 [Diacronema lutheri]|mmetsp:Transcript_18041/g.56184  ORF Transcript_18041/g.56184 Transcript_18041/m.56184 type:complete len:112 (-) Transcript_18041:24-359(-)